MGLEPISPSTQARGFSSLNYIPNGQLNALYDPLPPLEGQLYFCYLYSLVEGDTQVNCLDYRDYNSKISLASLFSFSCRGKLLKSDDLAFWQSYWYALNLTDTAVAHGTLLTNLRGKGIRTLSFPAPSTGVLPLNYSPLDNKCGASSPPVISCLFRHYFG